MDIDWSTAVALAGAVAREVQSPENTASHRVDQIRVEEGLPIQDFLEGLPDVPAKTEVDRETGVDLDVVLNVSRVRLVAAAGFDDGVIGDSAAVHCTEQ